MDGGFAHDLKQQGMAAGLSRLGDAVRYVAERTQANGHWREPDEEGDRTVKLQNVRVKPIGRAVRSAMGYKPDEDLADIYDPDSVTQSFYRPVLETAPNYFGRVKAGGEWCDPVSHHRLQIYRPDGTLTEKRVYTAEQLATLASTSEYRRSRFYETTGDWPKRLSGQDYDRVVMKPLKEGLEHWNAQNGERLKELREAQQTKEHDAARKRLRESCFDFDDDRGSGRDPMRDIDQEYIPLAGGPFHRQQYTFGNWEQTAKAFYERHHSDLAKAAITITSDFTLGRGITWKIADPLVREIWDEFWQRNDMDQYLRVLVEDMCWQGQLLIRKYEVLRGFMAIQSLDPSVFYEIVTDPRDVRRVIFYHQQNPSPWQMPFNTIRGVTVNVPSLVYTVTQYPANEIYHLKLNVSASEKWGRSDFFNSFGTLKRHRDWTNATTLKDMLQANLVWSVTVKGDQSDVSAFVNDPNNMQLPAFGGLWVQNEALTLEALHEDVASSGRMGQGSTGMFLTALFATAQCMPVTYFNATGSGQARATALTQAEPFVKKIATRQQLVRQLLDHLFEEVMKRAMAAGRVDRRRLALESADPEWIFPSLYEEDRNAKFSALDDAFDRLTISHRTLGVQQAQELGLAEYNYDEEKRAIQEEKAANWPPKPPPMMPGMPTQPGAELPPGMRPPATMPPGMKAQPGTIQNALAPNGQPGIGSVDQAQQGRGGLNDADSKSTFRQDQKS